MVCLLRDSAIRKCAGYIWRSQRNCITHVIEGLSTFNSAIPGRSQEATLHIAVTYITTDPLLFIIIMIIVGHFRHSSTLLQKTDLH
jgi:hypothetical protein